MEDSTGAAVTDRTEMLPIDSLHPNSWNRKTFSPDGLTELTASIRANGILEALVVRPIPNTPDHFEICSGNRRWLAARQAGLKEIPCRIQALSDIQVQATNLVANIQREEISALEKASMVKAFMNANNLTQAQMADKLGKSEVWLASLMGFLRLPPEVQKSVQGMNLSYGPMQAIASLPNDDYKAQIADELQQGLIKPEHIERRAHQLHNGFKASQAKRQKKADAQNSGDTERQIRTTADSQTAGDPLPVNPPIANPHSVNPPSANPPAAPTGQIMTALKDDLAAAYLPSFGSVGGVLKTTLDKAWGAPKEHLFKWGIVLAVVSFLWHPVLKTINYIFTRLMHVEVNQAINKNTIAPVSAVAEALETPRLTPAMLTSIPAPTGLKAELMSGQKVHLMWNPVPGVFGYNVYSAYENLDFTKETSQPTKDTEGLWTPPAGRARYRVVVTAVDAQDHESVYSQALSLDMR